MADRSFNTLAKKSYSTETHGYLPPPPPQLESDLKQYQRSHNYGRSIQNTTSATSQIIPPKIYDVAFFSLRVVVARVNPASATPITHILRSELNDTEICELIRDLCGDGGSKLAARAHTQAQPRLDPRRGKALRTKIDEARVVHARKLGEEQMVDVDIIYKCSRYQVEPFKSDMGLLAARGGRPYHMFPFREREKEMALSVIVAPAVLAGVYPPARRVAEHISFKTNTAAAVLFTHSIAVPDSPKLPGDGTMFPNWHPKPATKSPKKGLSRVCSKSGLRGRSSSVQEVVHSSSQVTLRPFHSSIDMDACEIKDEVPFSNDPGIFEEQWLVDELAMHKHNLDEWHRATWKTCSKNDQPHRHMSEDCEKDPSTTILGVDFPVKTPLCSTYTADRDMSWYSDHVEQTAERDYQEALVAYQEAICNAEKFYNYLTQLYLQSKQTSAPASIQKALGDAYHNKAMVLHNLRELRQTAADHGVHCERRMDVVQFSRPELLEANWRNLVKSFMPPSSQSEESSTVVLPTAIGNTPRPPVPLPIGPTLKGARQGGARSIHVVAPAGRQPNLVRQQPVTRTSRDTLAPAEQAEQQVRVPAMKKADSMIETDTKTEIEAFPSYHEPISGPADCTVADLPFARVRVQQSVAGADRTSDLTAVINRSKVDDHMVSNLTRSKRVTVRLSSLANPQGLAMLAPKLPHSKRATMSLSSLANPPTLVTASDWRGTNDSDGDEDSNEDSNEDEPVTLSQLQAAAGAPYHRSFVEDHMSESGSLRAEVQNR